MRTTRRKRGKDEEDAEAGYANAELFFRVMTTAALRAENESGTGERNGEEEEEEACSLVCGAKTGVLVAARGSQVHAALAATLVKISSPSTSAQHQHQQQRPDSANPELSCVTMVSAKTDRRLHLLRMYLSPDETLLACICVDDDGEHASDNESSTRSSTGLYIVDVASLVELCAGNAECASARGVPVPMPAPSTDDSNGTTAGIVDACFDTGKRTGVVNGDSDSLDAQFEVYAVTTSGHLLAISILNVHY